MDSTYQQLALANQGSQRALLRAKSPRAPVAGWALVAVTFLAPLALGCRPIVLMVGLGISLVVMTGVWGFELLVDIRKPFIFKWLWIFIATLTAFVGASLVNPTAAFYAGTRSFTQLGGVQWLPVTVDRWNSLLTVVQIVGALGGLLIAVDLGASAVWRLRLCVAASAAGAVVVIVGILEKMGPLAGLAGWIQRRHWAQGVPFGTFDYHGNAGSFLNLVIPAIAAMAIQARGPWRRLGWLVVLGACYVGVVLNVTRAGLAISVGLGPVIGGTVYWAVGSHRGWVLGLGVVAAMVIGGVVLTGRSPAVVRLGDRVRTLGLPYYDRTLTYKTAWELAKGRPVFGWGPGSYRLLVQTSPIRGNYFAPAYVPGESFSVLSNVEEDYLQTLAEEGWVGLGLWGVLVVGALVSLGIGWRRRGGRAAWAYVLIGAGIISVYAHALIDCPL